MKVLRNCAMFYALGQNGFMFRDVVNKQIIAIVNYLQENILLKSSIETFMVQHV